MSKKTYVIQENGQVTLPIEFRRRYGLKKGDVVVFRETSEGLLISPKETLVMKLLDQLGDALEANGVSLEELVESGREIRGEILRERYDIADEENE